jgi:hypothetical protein
MLLLMIVDDIGVTLRRLEDLGRPRWHFWLLLIPFYNIYLGLVLLLLPGTGPLPEESAPNPQLSPTVKGQGSTSEYVCPRCGRNINWGDPICPFCGDKIRY